MPAIVKQCHSAFTASTVRCMPGNTINTNLCYSCEWPLSQEGRTLVLLLRSMGVSPGKPRHPG